MPVYRLGMAVCTPPVRWWGRLDVSGLEHLPLEGPVLLAGNHDSYWDPVAVGVAGMPRRQIHALAKSELWKVPRPRPGTGRHGPDPDRPRQGRRRRARLAIERLRQGRCIGIFLEGTRSLGRTLRARSGFDRLAEAVPEAAIVCCTVTGTTDLPRFPKPAPDTAGPLLPPSRARRGAARRDLPSALLEEIRAHAPIAATGRRAPGASARPREMEKEKA